MTLNVFFTDDSRQRHPSRPGMTNLVATGALRLSSDRVRTTTQSLDELCRLSGFPPGEEFKWSPGRELWMHENLIGQERQTFFTEVCHILEENNAHAVVVIEDSSYAQATDAENHEMDVTALLIERLEHQCIRCDLDAIIITDRPGGNRRDEEKFLSNCLETLQGGTEYITPTHIIHNVVSTPSRLSRLIQSADLITSCTLSFVSGEDQYSPPIFSIIRTFLDSDRGRIGGVGLKLHPDFRFVNLYRWLVDDNFYRRGNSGIYLPHTDYPYHSGPNNP